MHVDTSDCNLSRFSLLLVNRNLPDLQILSCGSSERVRHLQDRETTLTPLELVEDVDISVNVPTDLLNWWTYMDLLTNIFTSF